MAQEVLKRHEGLVFGLSDQEYRQAAGIAQSDLKEMTISPAHYRSVTTRAERTPPTPEQSFGIAFHTLVLQPALFKNQYAVIPEGVEKKEKKEFCDTAEADGLETLDWDRWQRLLGMREAAMRVPLVRFAVEHSHIEVSAFASIVVNGHTLPRKGRIDIFPSQGCALADFKTTTRGSARPERWQWAVLDFSYHLQAAWYLDLANFLLGEERYTDFLHFVVEKEPPFAVGIYYFGADSINEGRILYSTLLNQVDECTESGQWPGYGDVPIPVVLPKRRRAIAW